MLRLGNRDDAPAMAEILVRGWQMAYRGVIPDAELDGLDIEKRSQGLQDRWKERLLIVSMNSDGRVVAFSSENAPTGLEGYDSEIGSLYALPEYSREGRGRELVGAMLDQFMVRGARSLCIHTLKGNKIGRSFYEKLGGQLVKEDTWNEYPAVWYGWRDLPELRRRCSLDHLH